MHCPICRQKFVFGNEQFCLQCGWKFISARTDFSGKVAREYQQLIESAKKDWKVITHFFAHNYDATRRQYLILILDLLDCEISSHSFNDLASGLRCYFG